MIKNINIYKPFADIKFMDIERFNAWIRLKDKEVSPTLRKGFEVLYEGLEGILDPNECQAKVDEVINNALDRIFFDTFDGKLKWSSSYKGTLLDKSTTKATVVNAAGKEVTISVTAGEDVHSGDYIDSYVYLGEGAYKLYIGFVPQRVAIMHFLRVGKERTIEILTEDVKTHGKYRKYALKDETSFPYIGGLFRGRRIAVPSEREYNFAKKVLARFSA